MIGPRQAALALVAVASIACGSAKPSAELLSARRAYSKAEESQAQETVPDKLLTAKQALESAERAHGDDARSGEEKTRAYIAERLALMAMVYANIVSARADTIAAQRDYRSELENRHGSAKARLGQTQSDLQRAQEELARQEAELAARKRALENREKELVQSKTELEKEREARIAAEAKAAAAIASLEEVAKIKEEARGLVITLSGGVLFKSGETDLLPIAERQLDRVAEALLEQDESKTIRVEGHTDSRGGARSNLRLSQARAESVRTYLVSKGVWSNRIIAVGKGETEPVAPNTTPEGRANNRRVEIVIAQQ